MAETCPHPLEAHLDGGAVDRPADPAALLADLRFDLGLRAAFAPARTDAIWAACLAAAPAPRRPAILFPWRPLATLAAAATLMAGVGTWSVAAWGDGGSIDPAAPVVHRPSAPEIVAVAAVSEALVLP
jgi:hypothetical protein